MNPVSFCSRNAAITMTGAETGAATIADWEATVASDSGRYG